MKEKYDKIGVKYNATRKADPFLAERLFYHLKPQKGLTYLDIGCGTGNYTIALNHKGINFIGIEPSDEMLKIAKSKSNNNDWQKGKVEHIPIRDNFFHGPIATLTTHHWKSLSKGFEELFRVLKAEATLLIFTSTPKQMSGYWLNHYFPKMLKESMMQMPKLDLVEESLKNAGFEISTMEKYFVKSDLKDLFLYAGKHNPELYLDEKIRYGISSFSSLAHHAEVATGLERLKTDITSGKIDEIIENHENTAGDYLYLVARKTPS